MTPDARNGWHHQWFTGYSLDIAMDADSEFITAIDVLAANADEAANATNLIQQEEQAQGNDVEAMSIDGIGFRGDLIDEWTDPEGLNLEVIVPPGEPTPVGWVLRRKHSRWTRPKRGTDLSSRPDDGDAGAECQRHRLEIPVQRPAVCGLSVAGAVPAGAEEDQEPVCDQE